MYKAIKILSKIGKILISALLFIPSCIYYPFYMANKKYRDWKRKRGYSLNTINRMIKYCDDYHKDKSKEELFIVDSHFYSEYESYLNFSRFLSIYPYWMRDKINRIYYSNMKLFEECVKEYYRNRFMSAEQIKEEFTRTDGTVSYWHHEVKDKMIVKF